MLVGILATCLANLLNVFKVSKSPDIAIFDLDRIQCINLACLLLTRNIYFTGNM